MKRYAFSLLFGVLALAGPASLWASYIDTVINSEPLVYYRMQEGSGSTAIDTANAAGAPQFGSQNGNYMSGDSTVAGTFVTGPALYQVTGNTATRYGTGSANNLRIDPLSQLGETFTVEFFFQNLRPDNSAVISGYLFSIGANTLTPSLSIGINGTYGSANFGGHQNELFLGVDNSANGIFTANAFNPVETNWYHLVMTRTAGPTSTNLALYINGASVLTTNLPGGTLSNNYIRFGARRNLDWPYNGDLDEVAVYNRALSASEVFAHYQSQFIPEPSTVLLLALGGGLIFRVARRRWATGKR